MRPSPEPHYSEKGLKGKSKSDKLCTLCTDDSHQFSQFSIRLGLEVKGTLGIIRKLMGPDRFQCDLDELSENLKCINFRVNDNIFWEIFRDIKHKPKFCILASWCSILWAQRYQ